MGNPPNFRRPRAARRAGSLAIPPRRCATHHTLRSVIPPRPSPWECQTSVKPPQSPQRQRRQQNVTCRERFSMYL